MICLFHNHFNLIWWYSCGPPYCTNSFLYFWPCFNALYLLVQVIAWVSGRLPCASLGYIKISHLNFCSFTPNLSNWLTIVCLYCRSFCQNLFVISWMFNVNRSNAIENQLQFQIANSQFSHFSVDLIILFC